MNIVCRIKGHQLADRVRIPPKSIPPDQLLLTPHSLIREDYCRRCGAVDDELDGWDFRWFRDFTWPKFTRRAKRFLRGAA